MKSYLKLILSGILFGLVIGILYAYFENLDLGIFMGLLSSIAIVFALSITQFLHNREVKRLSPETPVESYSLHQKRSISMTFPLDKVFDLCIESLGLLTRSKLLSQDRMNRNIQAKTGMTLTSFGEVISFDLIDRGNEATQVEISSKPTSSKNRYDFGKNLENVKLISEFLESRNKI